MYHYFLRVIQCIVKNMYTVHILTIHSLLQYFPHIIISHISLFLACHYFLDVIISRTSLFFCTSLFLAKVFCVDIYKLLLFVYYYFLYHYFMYVIIFYQSFLGICLYVIICTLLILILLFPVRYYFSPKVSRVYL